MTSEPSEAPAGGRIDRRFRAETRLADERYEDASAPAPLLEFVAVPDDQNQALEAARSHRHDETAAIRKLVTALSENERRFLNRRQADTREHERDTLLVGIFIAALSVTTRILIALGIRHVHSKRQAAIVEPEPEQELDDAPPAGAAGGSGA